MYSLSKYLFAVLFALLTLSASAQSFKPFKVNLSLGYARPVGPGSSGGLLASVEPKYGLTDQIDLGLRYELAGMIRNYTVNGQRASGELRGASSFVLTGTYLLTTRNFRPYVGTGIGIFSTAAASFTVNDGQGETNGDVAGGTKLGGLLRAGFKAGHFNVEVEYNLIPASRGFINRVSGNNFGYTSQNSYLGIKLGIDIGGGRYADDE